MVFDILGKSRHHQAVLGPPNWSSDFFQKLGAAGPAAFGENTFWKMTPLPPPPSPLPPTVLPHSSGGLGLECVG
jgi:hypothetical protein